MSVVLIFILIHCPVESAHSLVFSVRPPEREEVNNLNVSDREKKKEGHDRGYYFMRLLFILSYQFSVEALFINEECLKEVTGFRTVGIISRISKNKQRVVLVPYTSRADGKMATTKGLSTEETDTTNSATLSTMAASLALNSRVYSLEDFDTVATVGE